MNKSAYVIVFTIAMMLFSADMNPAHAQAVQVIKNAIRVAKPILEPNKTVNIPNIAVRDQVIDETIHQHRRKNKKDYEYKDQNNHDWSETAADTAICEVGGGVVLNVVSSGAEIMSTVSACPAMPAVAGIGTAYKLNKHVFNTNSKGDRAARKGTYAGATVGTVCSAGALAAYGAGPAGLAAIGGTLGGGMALGATAVIAAPAVGAVAIGCLCKWIFSD